MSTTEKDNVELKDSLDLLSTLTQYLRILGGIWYWLLILAIAGGGLAYAKAYHDYVPMYTASSTFTINIKKEQSILDTTTYYDNAAAEQMAQTFPYILTSDYLHRMVAADMGEPVTGIINATVTENTNLLTLSVTDYDPQKAYDTLNSVIKNYPSVSEPIVGKVTMRVLDETGVPTAPSNPKNFSKNVMRGAGIGLIIGMAWGILLFITNRTISDKSDIKKNLGISYLGSLPRINRKKRSKDVSKYFLLTDSSVSEILTEPFRMIKNKVEYHSHKYNHKTFLVTSATASEGKSFFAVNLALSLATSGKKIVLIDCDLRHPTVRQIFNMDENVGLAEYLKGEMELSEYLSFSQAQNKHTMPNLMFLPGGKAIDDGSHLLNSVRMQNLIKCAEANAEYVILDSAPAGLLTDSAVLAKYADAAIMVIRKEYARIDFILDTFTHLSESEIQIVGGVLNNG